MKATLCLTIVSSVLLAAGCATNQVHEADEGIEGTLRAEINQKDVHIDVDKGVVKLDGKVPTEADRQRLNSIVRNTPGVVAVKDELHVEFPTPGNYGALHSAVPVYATPPPALAAPDVVTTLPEPVVVPNFPRLRVQAVTPSDQPEANRIAAEVSAGGVDLSGVKQVTITVRHGAVALKGQVDSHEERNALIAAVESTGGVNAIYDQLQIE